MKMEVNPQTKYAKEDAVASIENEHSKDREYRIKEAEKDIFELFSKVFQLYKPDEILLSFNGGKDCTIVLHMLHLFFERNSCLESIKIPTLYITDPDAFEEIDEFVNECEKLYKISLTKKNGPIKAALKELCNSNPKIKAVFMGSRRIDPFCKDLKVMQMTDPDWPPLMRINPVIDWSSRQVWEYVFYYNVPYCKLYEKGYTSIGNKKNTKPNPYLRLIDAATGNITGYKHGKELMDDGLERAGRL